jgi:Zn-dependent metalloprotease
MHRCIPLVLCAAILGCETAPEPRTPSVSPVRAPLTGVLASDEPPTVSSEPEPDPVAVGAHVGKPRSRAPRSIGPRAATVHAARPAPAWRYEAVLRAAVAPRAAAPAPSVASGLVQLARRSVTPPYIELDGRLGTLRHFTGRVPNALPIGTSAAQCRTAARRMVEGAFAGIGLDAAQGDVELVERHALHDDDGGLSVAYDLSWQGLPVWFAGVRAQLDRDGALTALHAERLTALAPSSELRFDAAAAARLAAAALVEHSADGVIHEQDTAVLGIWVGDASHLRRGVRAWKVTHRYAARSGLPAIDESYVDASRGAVLGRFALVHTQTAEPATGTARDHAGQSFPVDIARFEEPGSDEVFYGLYDATTPGAVVTLHADNQSEYSAPEDIYAFPLTGSTGTDDWPPDHAVAHAGIGKVMEFFATELERKSWDGQGGPLPVAVHLGKGMDNAFFAGGSKPFVGINDDGVYAFSFARCLDVLAHEITHGVVNTTAGLVYVNQSGALNESMADVMGAMIDDSNWISGERCARFAKGFFRDLEDPTRGDQPAHMRDFQDLSPYEDHGGVHINSGIPNRAAFVAASATSRRTVTRVWYRALSRHLSSLSTFDDMARATDSACSELVQLGKVTAAECGEIKSAWQSVGILSVEPTGADCPENATLRGGVCECTSGFTPSADGAMCLAYEEVTCPDNSRQAAGQCYCNEGFFALDGECVEVGSACPANSSPNMFGNCQCDDGFQGHPHGLDGGCAVIESDCPANSHPEWADPEDAPDAYECLCNRGFVADTTTGECEVPPGGCGAETFYGRCDEHDLVYCGPDGIERVECAGSDLVCGLIDSRIGFDCLNPNGLAAAASCDPAEYQECGADNPFCVADSADLATGFCSLECTSQIDCDDGYGCCATVSDGTRACLTRDYCKELLDPEFACDDVEGGSTFFGACEGNVLRYCDPSTERTLEIPCFAKGKVCGFVDRETGYGCVMSSGIIAEAPEDWCPLEEDGICKPDAGAADDAGARNDAGARDDAGRPDMMMPEEDDTVAARCSCEIAGARPAGHRGWGIACVLALAISWRRLGQRRIRRRRPEGSMTLDVALGNAE